MLENFIRSLGLDKSPGEEYEGYAYSTQPSPVFKSLVKGIDIITALFFVVMFGLMVCSAYYHLIEKPKKETIDLVIQNQ